MDARNPLQRGFRLGSVLGFEIRIDASWFVIFFLVLWSLSRGFFPGTVPSLTPGTYLAMGTVATLLFFASLLAHELSHSVVARSRGIPVEGITLFIFGGMARTRSESETPGDELAIAGIGPLVSVLIGLAFIGAAGFASAIGAPEPVQAVAWYLGVVNLALAVFNLLPGFPLDGGRLFRALVWRSTGDLTKATRWASTGGRWLGAALMAFGLLQLFAGLPIGGLWLIFIGWFLRGAADLGYQDHLLRSVLAGVPARRLMTEHPETVGPSLTLQELVDEAFLQRRYQAFPVVDPFDRVLGLVTLDVVKRVPRGEWPVTAVSEVMIPADVNLVVAPDDSALTVLEKMRDSGAGRVLVAHEDRLIGIVSASDVTTWALKVRELGEPAPAPAPAR